MTFQTLLAMMGMQLSSTPAPKFVKDRVHIDVFDRGRRQGLSDALALIQQLSTDASIAEENAALRQENAKLQILKRITSVVLSALSEERHMRTRLCRDVLDELDAREWITESRGSYAFDDDGYRQETGAAFENVRYIAETGMLHVNHGNLFPADHLDQFMTNNPQDLLDYLRHTHTIVIPEAA